LESAQAQLGWDFPAPEPEALGRRWMQELDAHNVGAAALISSIPGDEASVAAVAAAFPDRFFPFVMVNPVAMFKGADASTFDMPAARAVCLFPAMHGFSMHDDCVRRIFEWAQQQRRAVFVHCGALSVGIRKKLGLPSPFDMRYSNPIDLHSVALRYPDVPIIVPHFGAGYFREALMLADLCPNVYLDTSSSNDWVKYQASRPTLAQVFRQALDVVGSQRLLFGTDSSFFPRGWQQSIFEAQSAALFDVGISPADARSIFGENLLRIVSR
jgi:hypothetical protein